MSRNRPLAVVDVHHATTPRRPQSPSSIISSIAPGTDRYRAVTAFDPLKSSSGVWPS